jgi:hypothetical protein
MRVTLAVSGMAVEVKERAVAGTGHGVEEKGGPALGMAVSSLSVEVLAVELAGRPRPCLAVVVAALAAGRDLPQR